MTYILKSESGGSINEAVAALALNGAVVLNSVEFNGKVGAEVALNEG